MPVAPVLGALPPLLRDCLLVPRPRRTAAGETLVRLRSIVEREASPSTVSSSIRSSSVSGDVPDASRERNASIRLFLAVVVVVVGGADGGGVGTSSVVTETFRPLLLLLLGNASRKHQGIVAVVLPSTLGNV